MKHFGIRTCVTQIILLLFLIFIVAISYLDAATMEKEDSHIQASNVETLVTQPPSSRSVPCKSPSISEEKIKSIWERDLLTGDWEGKRPTPEKDGVCLCANDTSEVLSIVDGGRKSATLYEGLLELAVDLDSNSLLKYNGGHFHANAYWLHGDNPSDRIGGLENLSNIEGFDRVRLFDFWYQQDFENDLVSLRGGLLGADEEFFISRYANTFINGAFGWPNNFALDLPNGGPNYPVAAPGLRLLLNPQDWVYVMGAIFTGNPGSETGNPHGTRLDFHDDQGVFSIAEAGFKINQENGAKGLPGIYKIGAWYHSGLFADQHLDDTNLSLADPQTSGRNLQHRGNYGLYLIGDQMVYRESGTHDQGLGVFTRLGWEPSERNLIDWYVDGGFNYKGILPGRSQDVFGIAVAWEKISNDVRTLDQDVNVSAIKAVSTAVHDYEMAIEITYQIVLAPWWTLQPDVQWIVHPGGSSAIPDATVVGVRTILRF